MGLSRKRIINCSSYIGIRFKGKNARHFCIYVGLPFFDGRVHGVYVPYVVRRIRVRPYLAHYYYPSSGVVRLGTSEASKNHRKTTGHGHRMRRVP